MYYETSYNPPYPAARLRISFRYKAQVIQLPIFDAMIDTGADCTCIPNTIISLLPKRLYSITELTSGGVKRAVTGIVLPSPKVEFLDQSNNLLLEMDYQELWPVEFDEPLIGRDIINSFICLFDAPNIKCSMKIP